MNDRSELLQIDTIAEALEADDPETALDLATEAMRRLDRPDPLLHFFAGNALLELGRPDAGIPHLEQAVELDPDDVDFRSDLALALFRSRRFEEAERHNAVALQTEPGTADHHELAALLAERQGRLEDADAGFREATRLDSERFPAPVRMDRETFEERVRRAADRLPDPFRQRLEEVAVTVDDLPSDEILAEGDGSLDPADLLGLFVGVSLPERSHLDPGGEMPPRILLFQRNLERFATDEDDLEEQITVTLYHELGHYLGLDEDELSAIDLD